MNEIAIGVAGAAGHEARWAMSEYFAELDRRFIGGFEIGEALEEAAAAFCPPDGAMLLARRGDEVVGCGGVQLVDPATAEIKRMWVSPTARGVGLGRRLLTALEAAAADLGATRVILDTNGVLAEAIRMYTTAGYDRIERYNDNPYAQLWFAKALR